LKALSPRFTLVTALLLASGACLWASPAGSVSGTVKDPSGALIPGVKLILVSLATNAQLTTVTNSGGEFQFLQLAPATYKLSAESSGFKKASVASVLVQVDQVTHVELSMEVGSVNESVQVEAVAPLLENDKSTKGLKLQELATVLEGAQKKLATTQAEADRLGEIKAKRDARIRASSRDFAITAVNQEWGFVVVGAGSNQGFASNTKLLVERDGQLLGSLKPTSVEPNQTIADVDMESLVPGVVLQPGDRVIVAEPAGN